MKSPIVLVFGPQTPIPSDQVLSDVRVRILEEQSFKPVVEALLNLEELQAALSKRYFPLIYEDTNTTQDIAYIKRWLTNTEQDTRPTFSNAFLNCLTILIQAVQCLEQFEKHSVNTKSSNNALRLLQSQGMCVGVLSTIAFLCSTDAASYGKQVAVALRLAFCLGAIVDMKDSEQAFVEKYRSYSVRCKAEHGVDKIILSLAHEDEAFVTVLVDDQTATVAVRSTSEERVIKSLINQGFQSFKTSLNGLWHNALNSEKASSLVAFVREQKPLQFGPIRRKHAASRSNSTSHLLVDESLQETAIKDILVNVCDWRSLLTSCTTEIQGNRSFISLGLAECVSQYFRSRHNVQMIKPPSLRRDMCIPDTGITSEPVAASYPHHAVAVVGMGCRFAGANSPSELWDILQTSKSMAREVPVSLFETSMYRDGQKLRRYWNNEITNAGDFDHKFFKMSAREAASTDPQQRILLETTYQALEHAGFFASDENDWSKTHDVGCFIGSATSDYTDNVASHQASAFSATGSLRAFLSGRLSHFFGWTGPSITYDTACSSSMVAIHEACKSLQLGECSTAVAGGVNVLTSPNMYHNLAAGMFLSSTGPTKAFDKDADGYCRGDGVGVVVLKRLDTALNAGDRILGVIAGSAVNQNTNHANITAPDQHSQSELIGKVLSMSGLKSSDISFIEAHGTGTQLGDKVEAESLAKIFAQKGVQGPWLSSIKANIGHTEGASGVAGLIKVLLMLQERIIPPQPNFFVPNPKIPSIVDGSLKVTQSARAWQTSSVYAALVNNFGASGNNAAAVILQPPSTESQRREETLEITRTVPIVLSSHSTTSLLATRKALGSQLERFKTASHASLAMQDLAYNISRQTNPFMEEQFAVCATSLPELQEALLDDDLCFKLPGQQKPVILAFGGQDRWTATIDLELFHGSNLLRHHLEECDSYITSLTGISIFPRIFDHSADQDLLMYHCCLFSVQYSIARTWIDCGLAVSSVVGHSFGQMTALCIAGCMSLHDTLKLVCSRAQLLQKHSKAGLGSMIALECGPDLVEQLVASSLASDPEHALEIACFNGPTSFVLAGSSEAIDRVATICEHHLPPGESVKHTRLHVRCAFHSRFMDTILDDFSKVAQSVTYHAPTVPIETCSNIRSWSKPDASLIVEHTRGPVYFHQALDRLSSQLGACVVLEGGIGSSVTAMARRALKSTNLSHAFLAMKQDLADAWKPIATTVAQLRKARHAVTFWPFHRTQRHQYGHVHVPPYQFDQVRHWLSYRQQSADLSLNKPNKSVDASAYLTFHGFKDKALLNSQFSLHRGHEKSALLTEGHAVIGLALAPAGLYIDAVIQSALSALEQSSGSTSSAIAVQVQDLEISAPLGLSSDGKLEIDLIEQGQASKDWLFGISSRAEDSSAVLHSKGSIRLHSANHDSPIKLLGDLNRKIDFDETYARVAATSTESMAGDIIYSFFSRFVDYAPYYQGVRSVASSGREAIATVIVPSDAPKTLRNGPLDLLEMDSFLHTAGIHVNLLSQKLKQEVFICNKIGLIRVESTYFRRKECTGTWKVYTSYKMTSDAEAICDVYVVNSSDPSEIQVAILGVQFTKVPMKSLLRVLRRCNNIVEDSPAVDGENDSGEVGQAVSANSSSKAAGSAANRISTVIKCLSGFLELPVNTLNARSVLDTLNIDSLLATELLRVIYDEFNVEISISEFLSCATISDLAQVLFKDSGDIPAEVPSTNGEIPSQADNGSMGQPMLSNGEQHSSTALLNADEVQQALRKTAAKFQTIHTESGFKDYWRHVYPAQEKLVTAYIIEAFASLGCNLHHIAAGASISLTQHHTKHSKLMVGLCEILREARLIKRSKDSYIRTSQKLDHSSSQNLWRRMCQEHVAYRSDFELLGITGPKIADHLGQESDNVNLTSSPPSTIGLLQKYFAESPMWVTVKRVLGDFVSGILCSTSASRPIKILEIGAGISDTAGVLTSLLDSLQVDYTYDWTDVSSTRIAEARERFSGASQMNVMELDISQPPPSNMVHQYDIVVSADHLGTAPDLVDACKNVRSLLRADGILALIERTRNIAWLDFVFGLLRQSVSSSDGRKPALVDETRWETVLRKSGFAHIDWTDGQSRESETIRVIVGYCTSPSTPIKPLQATRVLMQGHVDAGSKSIFAFPGGFGTAATYAPLPKITGDRAMFGLNSPFLNDIDRFTVPLHEFARLYASEIRRAQPSGPYSIMGYSVGGVIAYEAALQMVEAGDDVEELILLDAACPLSVPPFPLSLLDFFDSIDRFSGKQSSEESRKAKKMRDPHVLATLRCLEGYKPRPMPVHKAPRTVLFRAREGVDKQGQVPRPDVSIEEAKVIHWILDNRTKEDVLGWDSLVGNENLSVVYVNGNHFSMMTEPHVMELGNALSQRLADGF